MAQSSMDVELAVPFHVPAGHSTADVAPARHQLPGGQGWHDVAPSSSWKEPASHGMRDPSTQNEPSEQLMGSPAMQNAPALHGRWDVRVVGLSGSDASVKVSLPSPTASGAPPPPGQNSDGAPHGRALPATHHDPGGHVAHWSALRSPFSSPNVPGGQSVGAALPSSQLPPERNGFLHDAECLARFDSQMFTMRQQSNWLA